MTCSRSIFHSAYFYPLIVVLSYSRDGVVQRGKYETTSVASCKFFQTGTLALLLKRIYRLQQARAASSLGQSADSTFVLIEGLTAKSKEKLVDEDILDEIEAIATD